MTDAEIEAGLVDDLARRVAEDLAGEIGDDADMKSVVAVMVLRLRGAGIREDGLQIALLDRPRQLRDYYRELERLRTRHDAETDPARKRDLYIMMRQHQLIHNGKYGK